MTVWKEILCGKCNVIFCVSSEMNTVLRESGRSWWCPNGHERVFRVDTEEEARIKRERDRYKQDAARLEQYLAEEQTARQHAERRVSAARGQITKLKKRSAEGRCPCCNRVFVNLLSHMQSKHADYEAEPIDLETA